MVNQREALDRLNKEKDYEDHLVEVLNTYVLSCLDDIDLSEQQKTQIEGNLTIIRDDSVRHSSMFNNLVQLVVDSGEDNF